MPGHIMVSIGKSGGWVAIFFNRLFAVQAMSQNSSGWELLQKKD
jgi:hypothetical protein